MKTIRPIAIHSKGSKEGLLDLAKRAINAAEMNCSIVRVIINGIEALVYPNDSITVIAKHLKIELLMARLNDLHNGLDELKSK